MKCLNDCACSTCEKSRNIAHDIEKMDLERKAKSIAKKQITGKISKKSAQNAHFNNYAKFTKEFFK